MADLRALVEKWRASVNTVEMPGEMADGISGCADELQAALDAQAGGWLPIESAPVGVEIEILGWDGRSVDKTWVGWHEEETPVYVRADYVSWRPAHWMPLPQPPKESERWTL